MSIAELVMNSGRVVVTSGPSQAIEADLRQQDAALASALQSRKLAKTRHDQLKRDMEAIRKETAALGQQNDSDRLSGAADPKADAAKEARLRDLERRKK